MNLTYEKLCSIINDYYKNNIKEIDEIGVSFNEPIIGVSKATDPYYKFLKSDIGDFYWLPDENKRKKYSLKDTENLRVVSLVFPQTELTKQASRIQKKFTSYEWAKHRLVGQKFLNEFLDDIIKELNKMNIKALAPTRMDIWKNHKSEKYGYASSWSERHVAYASGLGTFGLSDGLITEKGKAHRCVSIVIEGDFEPTERPYSKYTQYCKFFSDASCRSCIKRCPANAITTKGHDKLKCREYQRDVLKPYIKATYELESSSCGLCQTGVVCQSRIPL